MIPTMRIRWLPPLMHCGRMILSTCISRPVVSLFMKEMSPEDYEAIENLDSRAVGPIYEAVKDWEEPIAISVLPGHPTPANSITHTAEPIRSSFGIRVSRLTKYGHLMKWQPAKAVTDSS